LRTEARGGLALADGSFKFPLGVKCWPRKTNVRMWRGWDEGAVLDIRAVKSIGARAVRLFAGPGLRERQRRLESALERLRWLLEGSATTAWRAS